MTENISGPAVSPGGMVTGQIDTCITQDISQNAKIVFTVFPLLNVAAFNFGTFLVRCLLGSGVYWRVAFISLFPFQMQRLKEEILLISC